MARTETLTAYRCKFSYIQRKNPLIDEYREDIKLGKAPEFTFSDFIALYTESTNNVLIGKNSNRAIGLTKDRILASEFDGVKFWYISPLAGKQGQPMTVLKRSTGKNMILVLTPQHCIIIICLCMKVIMKLLLFFIGKMGLVVKVFF